MKSQHTGTVGEVGPHIDLRDLRPQVYLDGVYALVNPQVGVTRNQKPYFKALLRDASGEVAVRMWTFDPEDFHEVSRTGFVHVSGQAQEYGGQVQLIAESMRAVEVDTAALAKLLPSTRHNIDAMFAEVTRLLQSMQHPAMVALANQYLSNESLVRGFKHAPAAVSVHHAWIGGLLEHTLQLLRLAEAMLPLYPELNRDLVLMGLFLHDLGKTVELEWERGFNYTADGNLIGHAVRGAIWLQAFAGAAARESGHRLPAEALRVLQHIVISHHGNPEFGAVKVPSSPEAIFVSALDNLDAKTAIALTAANRSKGDSHQPGHEFTERIWSIDTRIYRPDPLAAPEAPAEDHATPESA
ncbi:MAG: HD domain-containing protein [Phycisphaeraceae bacterium]|nr:HD domain-containing protein [Phycisphaeraceae bacterium]